MLDIRLTYKYTSQLQFYALSPVENFSSWKSHLYCQKVLNFLNYRYKSGKPCITPYAKDWNLLVKTLMEVTVGDSCSFTQLSPLCEFTWGQGCSPAMMLLVTLTEAFWLVLVMKVSFILNAKSNESAIMSRHAVKTDCHSETWHCGESLHWANAHTVTLVREE